MISVKQQIRHVMRAFWDCFCRFVHQNVPLKSSHSPVKRIKQPRFQKIVGLYERNRSFLDPDLDVLADFQCSIMNSWFESTGFTRSNKCSAKRSSWYRGKRLISFSSSSRLNARKCLEWQESGPLPQNCRSPSFWGDSFWNIFHHHLINKIKKQFGVNHFCFITSIIASITSLPIWSRNLCSGMSEQRSWDRNPVPRVNQNSEAWVVYSVPEVTMSQMFRSGLLDSWNERNWFPIESISYWRLVFLELFK